MEDQDRVSHSSVVTISSFPVRKDRDDNVQTFGKRCKAAKRDPNCTVVIRGWLNKKDSSGLKLWKRRWFVLSNYCLFYYKDSREESVLGSIPLPSYNILFCTPRECKNRKNTFKVVHQGMRSYFFSADTQEDMLGWVRALSQSACMESDGIINRRCSSYQDFTQIGGSSESVELPHSPSFRDGLSQNAAHATRSQREPSHLSGGRMGTPHAEQRGRRSVRHSPQPKTPSPPEYSRRRRGYIPNQDEDSPPFLSGPNTPPKATDLMGTGSLTPRSQLGSRPHTPVGRVDIRPQDDLTTPHTLCYAPASPKQEFKSTPHTPVTERWQREPAPTYSSLHHIPSGRRALGKSHSTGANTDLLPPLPPWRAPHAPQQHHNHRSHVSVCVLPPAMRPKCEREREPLTVHPLERDTDAVLTRLCGCDKLLQSLSIQLAQLQIDKDSVQYGLEMTRLQLEEWSSQGLRGQEAALTQKALLQEELVTIRARMCDVSLEMERVWSQYERMESELSVFRSHLQHICNFGMPQEQSQAQRELWMMEDILSGLKVNREHFRVLLGLQRHQGPVLVFQKTPPPHPGSLGSPTERPQGGLPIGVEPEPPVRPPLPQELQETNQGREQGHMWADSNYENIIYSGPVDALHRRGHSHPDLQGERSPGETAECQSSSRWTTPDTTTKKSRMSEEEQLERLKSNQDRLANRRRAPLHSPTAQTPGQSSEPHEEAPFPLRVTRVVTAVLPSSLIARRVSVEDPPPELANPLPEQIPPELHQKLSEQSQKSLSKPRRLPLEMPEQNLGRPQAEGTEEQSARRRMARVPQDPGSERHERGPYGHGSFRAQRHAQSLARASGEDPWGEASNTEPEELERPPRGRERAGLGNGGNDSESARAEGRPPPLMNSDLHPDLCMTPEQREAKLRRVERIRERVIRSAVRESTMVPGPGLVRGERRSLHSAPPTEITDPPRQRGDMSDCGLHEDCLGCCHCDGGLLPVCGTQDPQALRRTSTGGGEGGLNCHTGNKTHKDLSSMQGVIKHKKMASLSSNQISSVTVYQRNGGHRFQKRREGEPAKDQEEVLANRGEANSLSANLRTEWFLSTNQWQGFMPLQNHGIDSLFDEEEASNENRPPLCSDPGTDSNEDTSSVSKNLERMLENHSLFYKIACDINLSDNDITVTDGLPNIQPSSNQGEGEEGVTNEVLPADEEAYSVMGATDPQSRQPFESSTSHSRTPEDDGNIMTTNEQQERTQPKLSSNQTSCALTNPAPELCIYEEIPDDVKPSEDASQEDRLKVKEESNSSNLSAPDQVVSDETFSTDECVTAADFGAGEGDKLSRKTVEAEVSADLKAANSASGERSVREEAQTRGNGGDSSIPKCRRDSMCDEGGRAHQSSSFGTARVTVLRTSL